jgi:hypothetical protein
MIISSPRIFYYLAKFKNVSKYICNLYYILLHYNLLNKISMESTSEINSKIEKSNNEKNDIGNL